jgi:hypothetical protein
MAVGSLTTGATQGGAITQIVAKGAADFHLTGAATVTYWRLKHSTHTNFATEPIQQAFGNTVRFGPNSTASITLNRTGDLIHRQYIVIDIPGLFPKIVTGHETSYAYVLDEVASADASYMPDVELEAGLTNPLGGFYAHWANAIGFVMLKSVRLIVGGHVIDTLFADYLYCWEELSGKAGKRLQDMIGKFETREQLIAYSRRSQRLYVPLPFWYTQVAGNALSLVSLAFHGVVLAVEFEELKKCIIVSNRDIKVFVTNEDTGAATDSLVSDTDLQACVQTEYVYLDIQERNRFAEGLFDQLIHTVQCHSHDHSRGSSANLDLKFNHPVIELIFVAQLNANKTANRHFDYSRVGPGQGSGAVSSGVSHPTKLALQPQTEGTFDVLVEHEAESTGTTPNLIADNGMYNLGDVVTVNADPITSVNLRVNNLSRFATMEGKWFRQVQPWQHHTNIPKGFIYNYSFALHPEEPNPSGALNWSRLDNVIMEIGLHADISDQPLKIMVFARNWNVFSYVEGIGGNKFQT